MQRVGAVNEVGQGDGASGNWVDLDRGPERGDGLVAAEEGVGGEFAEG